MMKKNLNLFVLGAVVLMLTLFGCSGGTTTDTTAAGTVVDGVALYSSDCSGCHGSLAKSGKRGVSVAQIQDAISHNWGGMGAFSSYTTDQLQAIAAALSDPSTLTADTTDTTTTNGVDTPVSTASLDGAALYSSNCQSCHNPLATSTKAGRTMTQIQAAITGNFGGMGRYSSLSTAQVQAIADALATAQVSTPSPSSSTSDAANSFDGAALYASYCQGCHQPLASSAKKGRTAVQIQTAIGSVGSMSYLSTLTQTEIDAIASVLAAPASGSSGGTSTSGGTTTSTDGTALYTQYCSGCHGSSKQGSSATSIQTAINSNRGGMGSLSGLTSEQVLAIATGGTAAAPTPTPDPTPTPTPASTDGAALYTQYCGSCHGSLAASSKTGRSAAQIQSAITSVGSMNSLSSLTAAQLDAIAIALAAAPAPAPTDGAALYTSYCGSCHGPLATSTKSGATTAQIQTGISNNLGGMGQFSNLASTQIQAIASALSTGTAPTTPTLVCGSCHAIPPSTGHHTYHVNSQGLSCGTCHGTGYSKTAVNPATHNNGVVNIASGSTPGWNPTTRSCANSCHGTKRW